MNHRVPDFEMDEDPSIPSSSGFLSKRKSIMAEEGELLELLWQNGQVVTHSQNQRSSKRSPPLKFAADDAVPHGRLGSDARDEIGSSATATVAASHLFMQEDEMTSWLHYPIEESFDRDFCSDLLYPDSDGNSAVAGRSSQVQVDRRTEEKPPASAPAAASPRPPIYPTRRREVEAVANFTHFARGKGKSDSPPSNVEKACREPTVVDSSVTPPAVEPRVRFWQEEKAGAGSSGGIAASGATCGGSGERETGTCDGTVTSSSGVSGARGERARKRKAVQGEESEWQSEDAEYDSMDEKKVRRSTARRARAAEVHNLSERRRRDRINEKMKALQELIPRCNKSDKASMLDEAIEYLKSLQLQVQMMSMGCSMAPMMFPGMQQYMPPMGMGMGMGMDMVAANGFGQPMLPYPPILAGTTMPGPSASHLGPRFPMAPFYLPQMPPSDQPRVQATNMPDPASNLVILQCPNVQQQSPNVTNHHYLGLHHMQVPPQNKAMARQQSPNKGEETLEDHRSG